MPGDSWGPAGRSDMIRLISNIVRPYRLSLAIVFAAMIMETLMGLAGPWPLKVILDNVVGSNHLPRWLAQFVETLPGDAGKMQLALWAGLAVVVIAAIGAAASYLDSYFSESVAQRVAHDLRMRTYHHLQRLSLAYFDKHQVSASLSTLTTDIETIQDFASSGTLAILIDLLSVGGMLILMFWLNWDFALVAALVTPFLLWFVSRFKQAVKKATKQVRLNQSEIVAVELNGLQSQRVVEAFGTQALEEARLRRVSQAAVQSALQARRIKSMVSPVVTVTVALCTALVLWRGAGLVLGGAMTAGLLTVFLSYLARFFKPVQDLAKMTNAIAQTAVATERIQAILETDDILPERPNASTPRFLRGEIAFDRVAFSYTGDAPVLRDVSFRVEPGQFVGIVGPTGSGKTTIISLIPRFYDPTRGKVLIDGVDTRDYQLQGLRQHFGFVLQDTVLFRGTVEENIAYGRPTATADEIAEAARLANAHEFIERMPYGYRTMVGERGLTLSGGQRQRLGIARALVRNSPVLILDEPTAALDVESEGRVMEALERLMKGRTVVMIAHRLATLRAADRIIVVKDGVVSEEGTHDQLLSLGGVYTELHQEQANFGRAGALG
jgi:ABC-type multidrug transport system fused ATPase/permease subunit